MNDAFISMQGVKRCFPTSGGEFWALKGITADIPRGKLTILMGRSGSGKTTLMNILGALDMPTEGEVIFDGQNIVAMSEKKRALLRRSEIGFVFQSVALIPMMNACENVEYALRMARSREKRTERAMECLKMVGLGARMQHIPQELSGGEQQRVAVARALGMETNILLADEPTGNLDSKNSEYLFGILASLAHEDGYCVIIVTHDDALGKRADEMIRMQDGQLA